MICLVHLHPPATAEDRRKASLLAAYGLCLVRDTFAAAGLATPDGSEGPAEVWASVHAALQQTSLLLELRCGWEFQASPHTPYDAAAEAACRQAIRQAWERRSPAAAGGNPRL